MDLLEKFEAVSIQADRRISPVDKEFCDCHQNAYQAAITSFQELSFFWKDVCEAQKTQLGPINPDRNEFTEYLRSESGPKISESSIHSHIEALHKMFIKNLVYYFNKTYHVSVSYREVTEAMLPKEPDRYSVSKEAVMAYHEQLRSLVVKYEDVVDQVVLRLDGRTFTEQAFYELTEKCHKAAWFSHQGGPKFECKKATLRFDCHMCRFRDLYSSDQWELYDDMKDLLRGLAHFETGLFAVYPLGFSDLLGYGGIDENVREFSTCEKVKSLRMFKSGRVDLKFATESDAETFVNDYLGAVC